MIDILSQIVEVKKDEVKILKRDFTISRFSDSEYYFQKCLDFNNALAKPEAISIIAEVKKASPSKGIIRDDFNHLTIADIYMNYTEPLTYDSNKIEGNNLSWNVDFFDAYFNDYVMNAESRVVNIWAFVVTGLAIAFLLFGLIIKLFKKKKD